MMKRTAIIKYFQLYQERLKITVRSSAQKEAIAPPIECPVTMISRSP